MLRILLAVLFLAPQDAAEIDRLIRGLGSSLAETREQSEDGLVRMGDRALPALRKAVEAATPELSLKAKAMIAALERLQAERRHDLEKRAEILKETDFAEDRKESKDPDTHWIDGGRFIFSASPVGGGTVLSTYARNYLTRGPNPTADLSWDLAGAADLAGREATLERCGVCSPRLVFAKGVQGPIKVHLKGSLLWFSAYSLKIPDPKNGDQVRVGDFTIEVAWPTLKVTSKSPLPKGVFDRIGGEFTYELRPGAEDPRFGAFGGMGVGAGGGGGGRYGRGKGWCTCPDGPQPMPEKPKVEMLREAAFKHAALYTHPLPQVASILCPFRKPVEEPIDLTVQVAP